LKWLFQNKDGSKANRKTLLARLKSHINTVIGRYKEDVYCWDVVNEVVPSEGPELLRQSKWLEIVGEDYIARAFEYAHEADPTAFLFYNDYNECKPLKREKIHTLVKSLIERGVPIHGIGLQAHWNLNEPPIDYIRQAIERYASLGLKLQITEMDVSMYDNDDGSSGLTSPTEEMLARQADRYRHFFQLFKEYSGIITSVTFWGAADDYTYLDQFPIRGRKNWLFLFDTEHKPKQSFWKVAGIASSLENNY
jgi:endo-1,4-beta-xylanase